MRRLTAIFALVVAAATLALAIAVAINQFPRGLALLGCVLVAGASAWYGLRRRGIARVVGVIVAGIALVGAVALIVVGGARFVDLLIVAGLLVSLAAASAAFTIHVDLPSATAPRQPVLFFNPRSGGGKAERFQLAKEARERGIEPIELKPGDDLEVLVRGAVERGADGLAMAGGDGSQAIVAKVPPSAGCPTHACPPAPATTSRSISALTATTSPVRSTRSLMAVSVGWTSPRSTVAYSSTMSPSASTPRRSSAPATATPRSAPCWTPCLT